MEWKSKMVVGLVVTGFDKGGLEQVVYNLYKGYQANNIKTYILCEKPELMGYFAGLLDDVRDFCIFEGKLEVFISFCYRKQITHLHYHYNTAFISLARQCGIKTIYTVHNLYTWFEEHDMMEYGKLIKQYDSIVAVSSIVKQYLCNRCKIRLDRVDVIANGVNVDELLHSCQLPYSLTREGLGLDNGDFIFAQIASFTPVKHQIGLIGVFEKLCSFNPKIKLLLIGNVLDEQYYKDFEDILNCSSVKNNIKIVPFFPHKYIGQFMRTVINVSLLCTLQEGCSNTILESIVCGVPLIITNIGNAQDLKMNSVEVVPCAYPDVYKLNSQSITYYSHQKYAANTDEIVKLATKMFENYETYHDYAYLNQQEIKKFDVSTMVAQYIKNMENIK